MCKLFVLSYPSIKLFLKIRQKLINRTENPFCHWFGHVRTPKGWHLLGLFSRQCPLHSSASIKEDCGNGGRGLCRRCPCLPQCWPFLFTQLRISTPAPHSAGRCPHRRVLCKTHLLAAAALLHRSSTLPLGPPT